MRLVTFRYPSKLGTHIGALRDDGALFLEQLRRPHQRRLAIRVQRRLEAQAPDQRHPHPGYAILDPPPPVLRLVGQAERVA